MGASEDAVFYKVYKENGETKVSEPIHDISNLMANGVLTSPLFDLPSARTAAFNETKQEIDTSDNYLSGKIHQAISKRLKAKSGVGEVDIIDLINEELDKYETAQKQ